MKEYVSLLASQTVLTKQNMFFILAYHTLDWQGNIFNPRKKKQEIQFLGNGRLL